MKLKYKYYCNVLESLAPPVRMRSAQLSGQMVFCLPPTASCFLSCLKTAELRMQAKQFYLGLGRRFPLLLLIKAHWEWIQLWRGALRKKLLFQLLPWARPDPDITWCSVLCLGSLPCAYFCSSSPSSERIGMTGNERPWRSSSKHKIFTFPQRCYTPFYCFVVLVLGSSLSPMNGCSSHIPTNLCSKPNPVPMASHTGYGDNMIDFPAILGTRIIGHTHFQQ